MMQFQTLTLRRVLFAAVLASGAFAACSKETKPDTEAEPSAESAAPVATAAPESEPEKAAEPGQAEDDEATGGAPGGASAAAAASSPGKEEPKPPSAGGSPKPPPAKEEPKGYTGDKPCLAKTFKFASVRNACNKGGVDQAKSLMKGIVKRAKDDGKSIKCASCHDSTKTYTLKPNAVEDMRALQ